MRVAEGSRYIMAYRRSAVVASSSAVSKLVAAFTSSIAVASFVTVESTFVGFELVIMPK